MEPSALDDLARRLEMTRWPEVIPGSGFRHGMDLDVLRAFVEYWGGRLRLARPGAALQRLRSGGPDMRGVTEEAQRR